MYLRDLPGTTLEDLATEFDQKLKPWGGGAHEITLDLEADAPTLRLGSQEMIASESGLSVLASYFDVPPKFLLRCDKDEQQYILSNRIDRTGGELTVWWGGQGIAEVHSPTQVRIPPHHLVESAMRILPPDSPVVESWSDAGEMRVDVVVPEGFDRYVGGDPGEGDLTRGGVRFGQDRKHNTAPWVQPLLYRLVCTNGMEVPDLGIRVEARSATAEEITAMFEAEVKRAVDRLEDDIRAFYDLRNQPLGADPTGALRRAALEQNLPLRTVGRLEDLLPAVLAESGTATMFDVVNLMTNQANNPALGQRSSSRRNLQIAGGGLVYDHAERCSACHARLGA